MWAFWTHYFWTCSLSPTSLSFRQPCIYVCVRVSHSFPGDRYLSEGAFKCTLSTTVWKVCYSDWSLPTDFQNSVFVLQLFSEREKDISAFSSSSNKALRLLTSTPLLVVLFSLPSQNVLRLCAVVALLHGRKRKRNSFTFFNTCHWVSYICVALKWLQ